jgi:hypothetical protein
MGNGLAAEIELLTVLGWGNHDLSVGLLRVVDQLSG